VTDYKHTGLHTNKRRNEKLRNTVNGVKTFYTPLNPHNKNDTFKDQIKSNQHLKD